MGRRRNRMMPVEDQQGSSEDERKAEEKQQKLERRVARQVAVRRLKQ